MADWRTRNEVPDSDEEDTEISQGSLPKPADTSVRDEGTLSNENKERGGFQALTNDGDENGNEGQLVEEEGFKASTSNTFEKLGKFLEVDDEEDELALPAPRVVAPKQLPTTSLHRPFTIDDQDPDELLDGYGQAGGPPTGPHFLQALDAQPEENNPYRDDNDMEEELPLSPLTPLGPSTPPISSRASSVPTENPTSAYSNKELIVLIEKRRGQGEPNVHRESSAHLESSVQQEPSVREGSSIKPQRTFRKRNAVQINPYVIEGQRFREFCKGAGVKPINIVQVDEREMRDDPAVELSASDNDDETSLRATSDAKFSSPLQEDRVRFDSRSSSPSNQEEFPDVDTLLRPLQGAVSDGFKRRKIDHTKTKKAKQVHGRRQEGHRSSDNKQSKFKVPKGFNHATRRTPPHYGRSKESSPHAEPSTVGDNSEEESSQQQSHTEVRQVLPSPALTGSPQPSLTPGSEVLQVEGRQHASSPPQLQRPATSSVQKGKDRAPSRIQILSDDESDQDDSDKASMMSSLRSDEASDGETHQDLRHAQIRTRGVLPASWHRLDFQNQRSKAPKSQKAHKPSYRSPAKETRKGVARPVSSSRRQKQTTVDRGALPFAADESSDSQSQHAPSSRKRTQSIEPSIESRNLQVIEVSDDENSEDMEDNTVDAMLMTSSRAPRKPTKQRPHQQPKIIDVLQASVKYQVGKTDKKDSSMKNPGSSRKANQSIKISNNSKTETRAHEMSILDFADSSDPAMVPKFLQIARRTAQTRRGKGRHSPSKKILHLGNREDTQTVQDTLLTWKRGRLKSRKQYSSSHQRQPLTERTANDVAASKLVRGPQTNPIFSQGAVEELHGLPESSAARGKGAQHPFLQAIEEKAARGGGMGASGDRNKGYAGKKITSTVTPGRSQAPAILESRRVPPIRGSAQWTWDDFVRERYLHIQTHGAQPSTASGNNRAEDHPQSTKKLAQPKKRPPRQLPLYQQQVAKANPNWSYDDETIDVTYLGQEQANSTVGESGSGLLGLDPFGTEYTITFDFEHLPDGPLFDDTTLLGSGEFERSLKVLTFDASTNPLKAAVGTSDVEWRDWNETVSDQIGDCFRLLIENLHSERSSFDEGFIDADGMISRLDSLIRYLSTYLRFLDPIDRGVFAARFRNWLSLANDSIQEVFVDEALTLEFRRFITSIGIRLSIVANQFRMLASHETVSAEIQASTPSLFLNSLSQTVKALFLYGFGDFSLFLQETVRLSNHDTRRTARTSVETLVMLLHLVRRSQIAQDLWTILLEQGVLQLPAEKNNVQALDRVWRCMFSLLPYFEIDVHGNVHTQNYSSQKTANWKLVKQLLKPVLDSYFEPSVRQSPTFNTYCRATFSRCLHLILYWNWLDCESIVTYLFDFSACNRLADLPFEESKGSPSFLQKLTDRLRLGQERGDPYFDIFLKIVGSGLRALRSVASNKRIGNTVFRLTPNHNRDLPKDQAIRQKDLDAVRNHFNLLCTLYWAAPAGQRPRLDVLQHLINIEKSHQRACHLVIRSWSYLVNYQLSTLEPVSSLDPFVMWYNEILEKTVKLHKLARTEVENDARAAEVSIGRPVSQDTRENVVAKSQKNIEALLEEALSSLNRAIAEAKTATALIKLFTPALSKVLSLFDPKCARINGVIIHAFNVIRTFVDRAAALGENNDSQDFGDWSAFEELDPGINTCTTVHFDESIYKALIGLLSDAFGADISADDAILTSIIETWLSVAQMEVKAGNKVWNDFVNPYSPDSWNTLRSTEQKRRFTPFFFSVLIDLDPSTYSNNRTTVLSEWAASLVDRESLIKYQPVLTASLLNQMDNERLLDNPPFCKNTLSTKFEISITEFTRRRLALLSCFLSNMRESVSELHYFDLPEKQTVTLGYVEILKRLMSTMKTTYESLGQGSDTQGAYVAFVHSAVELLQQYTADICKVDPFFTNASNFPLPDSDPEYVVGRLKSLGLRLNSQGGPQNLSSFLQTLCERAAIEHKQVFYSSFIGTAMQDSFGFNRQENLTLSSFTFRVIVPTYLDLALSFSCGWIMAIPILSAAPPVLKSLLFHVNSFSQASTEATGSIILSVLCSIHQSCATSLSNPKLLLQAHAFHVLTHYLTIVLSTLETLAHISQLQLPSFSTGLALLENLRDFTLFLLGVDTRDQALDQDPSFANQTDLPPSRPELPSPLQPAHNFASDQLRGSLDPASRRCKWKVDAQGRYLFLRNQRWEEVRVQLGSFEQERSAFVEKAKEFVGTVERMAGLGIRPVGSRVRFAGNDKGGKVGRRAEESILF